MIQQGAGSSESYAEEIIEIRHGDSEVVIDSTPMLEVFALVVIVVGLIVWGWLRSKD